MMFRPVVRRRPLLRAAAMGGTYAAGRAMGRRAEQQDQSAADQQSLAQSAQAQQSGQVPGQRESAEAGPSVMDQLSQLTALHDKGALSDDEFAAAKAKILGS